MKRETKQFLGYILFAYGIGSLAYAATSSASMDMAGIAGWTFNSVLAFILIVLGSYLIAYSK